MRKLLAAPDPGPVLLAMAGAGVLGRVMPGAAPERRAAGLAHGPRDWVWRAARLGGDAEGWRLSRAEAKDLAALSEAADGGASPFALGDMLGARGADAVRLRAARRGAAADAGALALAERGAAAAFPLAAADLMPGLTGLDLGRALDAARTQWRESEGALDKAALMARVAR